MSDTVNDHGGTKLMHARASTRSTRKGKSKINKPRKLVEEMQARVPSKKMGEGILESWKDDQKENPTFFAFFKNENKDKNARNDVLLYDLTRVVLSDGQDYYHASWVDGCIREKQYILAQAPLKNTLDDFYRLVQQTKPEIIVMLQGTDSDEIKLLVTTKKVSVEKEVEKTEGWNIGQMTTGKIKTRMFMLKGWTDDLKPPTTFIESIEKLRKSVPHESKGPILVMCKDGATRSGIFALIDIEMERLKAKGRMKFIETVRAVRLQRSNVLETFESFDAGLNLIIDLAKKHT